MERKTMKQKPPTVDELFKELIDKRPLPNPDPIEIEKRRQKHLSMPAIIDADNNILSMREALEKYSINDFEISIIECNQQQLTLARFEQLPDFELHLLCGPEYPSLYQKSAIDEITNLTERGQSLILSEMKLIISIFKNIKGNNTNV